MFSVFSVANTCSDSSSFVVIPVQPLVNTLCFWWPREFIGNHAGAGGTGNPFSGKRAEASAPVRTRSFEVVDRGLNNNNQLEHFELFKCRKVCCSICCRIGLLHGVQNNPLRGVAVHLPKTLKNAEKQKQKTGPRSSVLLCVTLWGGLQFVSQLPPSNF